MGVDRREQPFDSIESAYEFMDILAQTMMGVMVDLHRDYQIAMQEGETRRARAIELALFKSKNLACYVTKSRRVLNDLRTIRRLILNERMTPEQVLTSVQTL
jgi:predicted methyltransferase